MGSAVTGTTFLQDILQLSVDIELECAGVYEVFARHCSNHLELGVFWRLYAEAERYHAASIRIHQATFDGDTVEGDAFPVEADESREFLRQLRTWREQMGTARPSLTTMFDVARQIESSTAELHGRTQFFALYPRFAELFTRMVQEDQDHRSVLDEAATRFADEQL